MVKEGDKGSFRAKFNTPCKVCKANISPGDTAHFVKGENGYWCGECEQKRLASVPQEQNAPRLSSNERVAFLEEENKNLRMAMGDRQWRANEISEAHKQNMESAKLMRDTICLLVAAMNGLTTQMDMHRQALVDLRIALEGKR